MKLSIIIPTFNSVKTIPKCLDSIVSQSFEDWEVLVMDGVSTDNTVAMAQSYGDSRIKVFSEPDCGIYDAMNKGIRKSKGEWLYFLGSDDYLYESTCLERLFHFCNLEEYDVVYGNIDAPHWPENLKGEWRIEHYMDNRCHQAIFYRRSFFCSTRGGGYNIAYSVCADRAVNMQWFLSPKYRKLYIPIKIAHYSDGGYSSNTVDSVYQKDEPLIILKYGHKILPNEEKKKMAWWYMSMNPENHLLNSLLKLYVIFLRIESKVSRQ